jgi:e3 binding domain
VDRKPATNSENSRSSARPASQKTEEYRFAQNVEGRPTAAEREYRDYATSPLAETGEEPDVLLDVPVVKVDKIHLKVADLEAHVALKAQVLDLVSLDVGIDAHLGKLEIDIEGVEAQALVKVRLDQVGAIVDRVLTTIDRNPELVKSLGQAVEEIGAGAGDLAGETGETLTEVGRGAEEALPELGRGAGEAVEQVGQGAGQAVGDLGQGAGEAVGEVGQGAGQAVGGVGKSVGEAAGGARQALGGLGQATGESGGSKDQGEGVAEAGGQVPGQTGAPARRGDGQPDEPGIAAPKHAKEAAKVVAKEIGAAASDEAKDLGLAATRKVMEFGERRRRRRAEKYSDNAGEEEPDATEAAVRQAEELGVDLYEIEGSGADGRITVRDVRQAAAEQ